MGQPGNLEVRSVLLHMRPTLLQINMLTAQQLALLRIQRTMEVGLQVARGIDSIYLGDVVITHLSSTPLER